MVAQHRAKDLGGLLEKYSQTKNARDFEKLCQWLGVPWMHFNLLYAVYSEMKLFDEVRSYGEYAELREKITEFMLAGAIHNRYGRNQLCSLYEIAKSEGKEDEILKIIDRWAAIGQDGWDKRTWRLFWASYPDTRLSELAEKKLAELGAPVPEMSEKERALESIEILLSSCAI